MSESEFFEALRRIPVLWVPELPDRRVPIYCHSPFCLCDECRLRESIRRRDNPGLPDTLPL